MRLLPCSCLLLLGGLGAQDDPPAPDPVAQLQRFELEVLHWEGTFGSYLLPTAGDVLVVDLGSLGARDLVRVPLTREGEDEAVVGHFDLAHLERVSDTVEGDAVHGWTRRVILAGRRRPKDREKTVLEFVIQYEVERWDVSGGRRAKLRSNQTHVSLRLHTLRDDDTIREYGRAQAFHDRDSGVRSPEPDRR